VLDLAKHFRTNGQGPGFPKLVEWMGEKRAKAFASWAQYPEHQHNKPSRDRSGDAETMAAEGADTDLPVIQVVDGEIARQVDETQDALIASGVPIFVRGNMLVEPITVERPASKGSNGEERVTQTTVFVPLTPNKVRYILNKHAARFTRYDGRKKEWVPTDPPQKAVDDLLALRTWSFPPVFGVISAPTLRPDGSILSAHGYDPTTRLWCCSDVELPDIPDQPTRADAEAALKLYSDLLSGFPFIEGVDRAVALAASMTVVLRGAFDHAPMFLVLGHEMGTGKSYLVDVIAIIVTGRPCPVLSPGKSTEEMEKRIGAVVLEGGEVRSLDNLSFDLESDLLCEILTQLSVKVRILGQSSMPECEWKGTLFGTANNVRVVGDLVRRTLTCRLDAKVERPELRRFAFRPHERVLNDRVGYIAAAITMARAWRAAGKPGSGSVAPLGSFEGWCEYVRHPLLWLGLADPVDSMERSRQDDPRRATARELINRWEKCIKVGRVMTAAEMIRHVNQTKDNGLHRYPQFRAFLIENAGTTRRDAIDATRLGKWLWREHGKVYGQFRIDIMQRPSKTNAYVLRSTAPRNPDLLME
jgi:putative DNA primase/helicase